MPQEQPPPFTARKPFTRSKARQLSEIEEAATEAMVQLKECTPPEAAQKSEKQSTPSTKQLSKRKSKFLRS